MKVKIEMDEVWPVFTIFDAVNRPRTIERCLCQDEYTDLPDELAHKFLKIQEEYNAMQKQLEEIYDRVQNEDGFEAAENSLRNDLSQNSTRVHAAS